MTNPDARPADPPISKSQKKNIQVSPAVADAARKDGDSLLGDLQTTASGLSQPEAEDRARRTGPNVIAQERPQNWFIRLLKIVRNPLVILLAARRRFPSLPVTRGLAR